MSTAALGDVNVGITDVGTVNVGITNMGTVDVGLVNVGIIDEGTVHVGIVDVGTVGTSSVAEPMREKHWWGFERFTAVHELRTFLALSSHFTD